MRKLYSEHKSLVVASVIFCALLLCRALVYWRLFPIVNQTWEMYPSLQSWWFRLFIAVIILYFAHFINFLFSTRTYNDAVVMLAPSSGDALYERGIFHYKEHNYDAAMRAFTRVVSLLPFHSDAYVYIGLIHKEQKELIDAIAAFTNALNLNPKNWYALHHRGSCKFESGDNEGAILDLTRSIDLDSKRTESFFVRGYCYRKSERYEEAIQDFSSVLAFDPKNEQAYLSRGYCQYLLGNATKAIPDFDIGIELNPANSVLYQLRGMAYSDLGYHKLSIEDLLRSTELAPSNFESWLNLSKAYAKNCDNEKAKHYLDKAMDLKPDEPSVMLHYAIHQFNHNDPNALALLDQAVASNPNHIDFLHTRALALTQLGEYKRAITDWDRVLAKKPRDWKHRLERAKCRAKIGDIAGAVVDCEAALRGDKKNDEACATLGQHLRIGHYWTESLTLHQMIIELSPQCWQAWIGLADTARHLKNDELYAQALAQIRKWLPTHDPYDLACLESVAGNLVLAKEYLATGLNERPQRKSWAKEDPDLFWLRQDPQAVDLFE